MEFLRWLFWKELTELRGDIKTLTREFRKMSAQLDRLTAEVSETRAAAASIITLVHGLAEQIRELKEDPAALEALANELDAAQSEIAAAVTANTPTEPNPEEPAA